MVPTFVDMFPWRRRHMPPARIARSFKKKSSDEYPVEEAPVKWIECSSTAECLPASAFVACTLETGEEAFVAMVHIGRQKVTGLTTRNGLQACVPYGSSEHILNHYKVMTSEFPDSLFWVRHSNGDVPRHAVRGGMDSGEINFIGRTCSPLLGGRTYLGARINLNRNITEGTRLGKIHPSHNCLYIPYNGGEYIFNTYEVLCHKISPAPLSVICRWKIYDHFIKLNRDFATSISNLPLPNSLRDFLMMK